MKNKVITMFLLASMICSSSVIPAFAAEGADGSDDPVIYQTVTNESDNKSPVTEVKASIKSTYEVMLPKTMTVNNGDNAYNVNVKGDLVSDETISVIPDTTLSLSSEGKDAIIGNITQEKQEFTYIDVSKKTDDILTGTDAAGNININGLTAGHWSGIFNFNVEINKYVPMSANLNADKSNAKLEDTVNLTANVTNGKAPYQYQFKMRKKGTENWTNLTEYGTSNTYTWTVDKKGTYEIAVDIKDANANIVTKTTDITAVTNIGKNISLTKNDIETYNIAKSGTVVVPSSVTDSSGIKHKVSGISGNAFMNCVNIQSVVLPDTISSISDNAFVNCFNLASITYRNIAYDVKSKLANAISLHSGTIDINSLSNTNMLDDNITLDTNNVHDFGINLTGDVVFPSVVSKDGKRYRVTKLSGIKDSRLNIFGGTRNGNEIMNITSVTIPNTVKTIGDYTFYAVTGLKKVNIPNGVVTIGRSAFDLCDLQDLILPNSVKKLSHWCFSGNTELNSTIQIPNSVTFIGSGALAYEYHMQKLILSDNVKQIHSYAFRDARALKTIVYKGVEYRNQKDLLNALTANGCTCDSPETWFESSAFPES